MVDANSGPDHTVVATPPNVHDLAVEGSLLHGDEAVFHAVGVHGHRPRVRHTRRGVDGGHATGQPSAAGAAVGLCGNGPGQGLGPRKGQAPVPGHQAAGRPREDAVPGLAKNGSRLVTLFALSKLWMARRTLLAG